MQNIPFICRKTLWKHFKIQQSPVSGKCFISVLVSIDSVFVCLPVNFHCLPSNRPLLTNILLYTSWERGSTGPISMRKWYRQRLLSASYPKALKRASLRGFPLKVKYGMQSVKSYMKMKGFSFESEVQWP